MKPKRRIALAFLVALVALAATAIQSSASGGLTDCGGGVRAAIVSCPKAKRIAKEYKKTRAHALQGYRCSSKHKGDKIKGRCALDRKLVVFSFRP